MFTAESDSHCFGILEDNEADLFILMQTLRKAVPACDITAFADGAEALAYLNGAASRVPDLVILDFRCPRRGGRFCPEWRSRQPPVGACRCLHVHGFTKSGRHGQSLTGPELGWLYLVRRMASEAGRLCLRAPRGNIA